MINQFIMMNKQLNLLLKHWSNYPTLKTIPPKANKNHCKLKLYAKDKRFKNIYIKNINIKFETNYLHFHVKSQKHTKIFKI